jgi:DNA primase
MQIAEEKITEIKNAADIVGVISESVELKQAGKDYIGLCPFHPEKTPSFTVCPGKQMYFCFGCSASGDVFKFLEIYKGLSFLAAAKQLADKYGIQLPETSAAVPARGTPKPPGIKAEHRTLNEKNNQQSIINNQQSELWQEKAGKLVAWAHEKLLGNTAQLKILADRGIKKETVEYFRLGWNPGKDGKDIFRPRESWGLPTEMKDGRKKKLWIPIGLVIPMFSGETAHRLRFRRPDGKPKYYIIPGSSMATWIMQKSKRVYVIIESELDGILLWQEAREVTGIISLGSASTRPDPAAVNLLEQSALILNALDFDTAGAKAFNFWDEAFPQSVRWPVPAGKDPGEAFQSGIDLKEWITSGFPEGWRVGQSLFGSKKEAENIPERSKNEPAAGKEVSTQREGEKVQPQSDSGGLPADLRPALVPEVYKLEKLLKQYPVSIFNTAKQIRLREHMMWANKNWKISKEISDLVFNTKTGVFKYICEHPAKIITGDNLIY